MLFRQFMCQLRLGDRSRMEKESHLALPFPFSCNTSTCSLLDYSDESSISSKGVCSDLEESMDTIKKRVGKGSHMLTTVRCLLKDSSKWEPIRTKEEYHFPGLLGSKRIQTMYFTTDCSKLPQYCEQSSHFIWDDIQLSKGKLNKDRLIEVMVDNDKLHLYYRSAPCNGVKQCSAPECMYTVPVTEKRSCPTHPMFPLVKTEGAQWSMYISILQMQKGINVAG